MNIGLLIHDQQKREELQATLRSEHSALTRSANDASASSYAQAERSENQVIVYSTSGEALGEILGAFHNHRPLPIEVFVLDLVQPGISGIVLIERLRQHIPHAAISILVVIDESPECKRLMEEHHLDIALVHLPLFVGEEPAPAPILPTPINVGAQFIAPSTPTTNVAPAPAPKKSPKPPTPKRKLVRR